MYTTNLMAGFFIPLQKDAVVCSVKCNPNATGSKIIRNMSNIEDPEDQIDFKHQGSVDLLVQVLGGVDESSSSEDDITKIKRMAEQNRFDDVVKVHNMDLILHHFEEHEIYFTSYSFDHILHYGMTTEHNL